MIGPLWLNDSDCRAVSFVHPRRFSDDGAFSSSACALLSPEKGRIWQTHVVAPARILEGKEVRES